MEAKVLRYSNADTGEDLALLMVRKKNFVSASATFDLDDKTQVGDPLLHVGSLLGQMGANSMTSGIMSQIGRVFNNTVYNQTTVTAFPGSSGGGVYTQKGEYCGMLVRGAGENFNLIVPVSRIRDWTVKQKLEFAIDPNAKVPSLDELNKFPIEDTGHVWSGGSNAAKPVDPHSKSSLETEFPFLIKLYHPTLEEVYVLKGI